MKRKFIRMGFAVGCISMMMAAGTLTAAAESDTEMKAEAATEAVTEALTEELTEALTEAPEPVEIQAGEYVLTDLTGKAVTAQIKERETEKEENITEAAAQAGAEGEEEAEEEVPDTLILTAEGTDHIFENLFLAKMNDMTITAEDGYLFIKYKNEDGEKKTAYETADVKELETPDKRYITDTVYIHAEADLDSEKIGSAKLGDEIEVIAVSPKVCKIRFGEKEGYVSRRYVSQSKKEAEEAVNAEAYARKQIEEAAAAAARAQAAAAAAAQAQANSSRSNKGNHSGGKKIVSQERMDDCDGSGHGVLVITYSDGSIATKDY